MNRCKRGFNLLKDFGIHDIVLENLKIVIMLWSNILRAHEPINNVKRFLSFYVSLEHVLTV